jgi:acetylornithine deacetylase/succinyl-diaminopimelate desuccinylase-like protein
MNEFQSILEDLRKEVPDLNASVKATLVRSATEVEAISPLVESLMLACKNELVEVEVHGMTAWVEASLLNEAGIPAVCFGPGSIGQAHSDDEWIDPQEIEQCASILEQLARDFLK